MKYSVLILLIVSSVLLVAFVIQPKAESTKYVAHTIEFIKQQLPTFAQATEELETAINDIQKNDSSSVLRAITALEKSRAIYKRIEFFLTYFFRSNSLVYNEPPNYEVEEPYFDYRSPTGFQVIEEILFSKNPFEGKEELEQQAALLKSSASDIYSYLYNLDINDRQILECVRLGMIRVITLGITGFDAPDLKTGISESGAAMSALKIVLQPLLDEKNSKADSLAWYLNRAIETLNNNADFDSFDRLSFLTKTMFPLQTQLGLVIRKKNLYLNTTGVINYDAKNLFSRDALFIDPKSNPYNLPIFPTDSNAIFVAMHSKPSTDIVALGRKLFFERLLSGNGTRSCGSCHQPEKYFTDNLPKAKTLNGDTVVTRNTPTLLYVGYQYSQFWDGRATNLENQIKTVLRNPVEMNADFKTILHRLKNNKKYFADFAKAFPDAEKDSSISIKNLTVAISGFLKTLAPFDSPFDHFMDGNVLSLTNEQKRGFNLFMGKAACATCHFAPVFNGLLPPFYDMTELENLGVTKDTNFTRPFLDVDSGRYLASAAKYYMRKFKIPGLRDIEKTAPYMHSGAFPDLKSVMEFYNKGGGEGLGLSVPNQTLSSKHLNLTENEMADIIQFLNSLTDSNHSVSMLSAYKD